MMSHLVALILFISVGINASESFNAGNVFSGTSFGSASHIIKSTPSVLPEIEPVPEIYAGGFFGVRARVELIREHNLAYIILEGIPLGGRVAGTARFAQGTSNGSVDLSEGLARTVRRRGVQIVGVDEVHEDATTKECVICIRLKLPVVGVQCLKMARADTVTVTPSKKVLVRRGGSTGNEDVMNGSINAGQNESNEVLTDVDVNVGVCDDSIDNNERQSIRKRIFGFAKKINKL